ncbi:glycosyltransferase family 4 protein [Luteibacter sp. NPDC031894]|uniref:glycosyltransferase family 4 protein n=1 Tax=Luteibacter sp. NPDC031894 TaxID=3390572 RepID=UPI003CFC6205
MERLNLHMAIGLAAHFRVIVIGPRGARTALPASIEVHECGRGTLRSFLVAAWFRSLRAAVKTSPAWIVAGSGLTAPMAWMAARLSGARMATYVHGLDLVVDNTLYRALWLPFVRRMDACIANSANTARLARAAGVPESALHIVHPGVALPEPRPPQDAVAAFRRRNGLEGRPILLSVGRMTERKGLREFVLQALPTIRRWHPTALLVVIGDEAPDALAGAAVGAWSRLRDEADAAGLGDALVHLGVLDDQQLSAAYASGDVHVFPIRDVPGDVEGFGMVAVEAAAHGLPTVAFAVGGAPDAVSDGVTGYLVGAGDYDAFAQRVIQVLDGDRAPGEALIAFAERFAWPEFIRRLTAILARAGAA